MTGAECERLIQFAQRVTLPVMPTDPELARLAKQKIARRDWFEYLLSFASCERLEPFLSIQHLLDEAEYWPLLADVWIASEFGVDALPLWTWLFVENHGRSGAAAMMEPEERARWESLPPAFTVFRGQLARDHPRGFSWTLSRERAVWFATKYRARMGRGSHGSVQTVVLAAMVPKPDTLAYLNRRQEEEILIPPTWSGEIWVQTP